MYILNIKNLVLIICGLFSLTGFTQHVKNNSNEQSIKVALKNTATDDENSRSMGMLLLFKLNGNVVHKALDQVTGDAFDLVLDTIDFTTLNQELVIDEKTKKKGRVVLKPSKFIRIGLPLKSSDINRYDSETSQYYYGYLFNEHRSNQLEPLNTLILIEADYMNNRPAKIWIDYNNNFDFADEVSITWKYPAQNLRIPFPLKTSKSDIRISRFPYYKFRQFSSMQDTAMKVLSNGREFVGSRECLKIVRENIIFGEFVFQEDTVLVGIQDVNLNGDFQDSKVDRIVVGSAKNDEFSASLAQVISDENHLVWMGNLFDVEILKSIDLALKLTPSKLNKSDFSLVLNEKIPRFKFEYLDKKKVKSKDSNKPRRNKRRAIRKIKADSKLIYVWSAENELFMQDSAQLHQWSRLHPDVQLVMLNFGGSSKYLSSYNNRYSIQAIQGFLTSKIVKKLKLQTMPQYFLLDKKNRIRYMGHSISKLNELNLN
jgi:hypothetical protein